MRALVQPLWQQKHPSPSSASWEFHWHPRALDGAVTSAVAAMDLALAGGSGFLLGPRQLVWLRTFSATSASEQRGYVGLAGVWVRPAPGDEISWPDMVPALLAGLELPAAAPHTGAPDATRTVELEPLPPGPVDAVDPEALARIVVAGGRAAVAEPGDAALASLVGRALAWLPPAARVRERRGAFVADTRLVTPTAGVDEHIVHYLARAWITGDPSAWRLIATACAASGRGLVELFRDLTDLSAAWESGKDLARWLAAGVIAPDELERCDAAAPAPLFAEPGDAGLLWNRVLHYWGRGFLAGPGLEQRLARVLAGRVLVDHLVRLDEAATDPLRYLRRLRTEALLPSPRVAVLARELTRELPGALA